MEMVFYCPTCNRETDNCSCEKDQLRARVAELEAQLADHKKLLLLAKEALASASTFGGFVNAVAQKAALLGATFDYLEQIA